MPVTSVLGAHWGDEGKGKVAAALSADAAVCARFQGGPNAAHTVWRPGAQEPVVLRMVPSGVVAGATGVIGRGCVIEPRMLLDEVDRLADHGIDVAATLVLSDRAHVITAAHADATPAVRLLPGWDAAAGARTGALGEFLAAIEAATGVAVLGVSDGPGVDDWLLRPRVGC